MLPFGASIKIIIVLAIIWAFTLALHYDIPGFFTFVYDPNMVDDKGLKVSEASQKKVKEEEKKSATTFAAVPSVLLTVVALIMIARG